MILSWLLLKLELNHNLSPIFGYSDFSDYLDYYHYK